MFHVFTRFLAVGVETNGQMAGVWLDNGLPSFCMLAMASSVYGFVLRRMNLIA